MHLRISLMIFYFSKNIEFWGIFLERFQDGRQLFCLSIIRYSKFTVFAQSLWFIPAQQQIEHLACSRIDHQSHCRIFAKCWGGMDAFFHIWTGRLRKLQSLFPVVTSYPGCRQKEAASRLLQAAFRLIQAAPDCNHCIQGVSRLLQADCILLSRLPDFLSIYV